MVSLRFPARSTINPFRLAAGHLTQELPQAKAKRLDLGRKPDRSRARPPYEVYVVFAGLQPGIYSSWYVLFPMSMYLADTII